MSETGNNIPPPSSMVPQVHDIHQAVASTLDSQGLWAQQGLLFSGLLVQELQSAQRSLTDY
eukprot:856691-Pelagomonas_calceolata.AAC.4